MSSSCLNSLISHTRLAGRWWVSKSQGEKLQINKRVGCATAELQLPETRAQGPQSSSEHSSLQPRAEAPSPTPEQVTLLQLLGSWDGDTHKTKGQPMPTMSTLPLKRHFVVSGHLHPPGCSRDLPFPSKNNAKEGRDEIPSPIILESSLLPNLSFLSWELLTHHLFF